MDEFTLDDLHVIQGWYMCVLNEGMTFPEDEETFAKLQSLIAERTATNDV